jgi:hypothetical protein
LQPDPFNKKYSSSKSTIMKAIIYAGIGLFAVASVYGVADYYSSKKKGTLDKLYKEEEVTEAAASETKVLSTAAPIDQVKVIPAVSKTTVASTKATRKTKASRRRISIDDFSRGRIDRVPIELIKPVEEIKPVEVIKENPAPKEDPVMDKVVKAGAETIAPEQERKISLEMFSRAPLRKVRTVKKN